MTIAAEQKFSVSISDATEPSLEVLTIGLPYRGNPTTSLTAFAAGSLLSNATNAWPLIRRFLCAVTDSTVPYVENSASNDFFSTVTKRRRYQSARFLHQMYEGIERLTIQLDFLIEILYIDRLIRIWRYDQLCLLIFA